MTRIRKWLKDNVVELGMFAEWFLDGRFYEIRDRLKQEFSKS